jgi:hypothetical protein
MGAHRPIQEIIPKCRNARFNAKLLTGPGMVLKNHRNDLEQRATGVRRALPISDRACLRHEAMWLRVAPPEFRSTSPIHDLVSDRFS